MILNRPRIGLGQWDEPVCWINYSEVLSISFISVSYLYKVSYSINYTVYIILYNLIHTTLLRNCVYQFQFRSLQLK